MGRLILLEFNYPVRLLRPSQLQSIKYCQKIATTVPVVRNLALLYQQSRAAFSSLSRREQKAFHSAGSRNASGLSLAKLISAVSPRALADTALNRHCESKVTPPRKAPADKNELRLLPRDIDVRSKLLPFLLV